jgi:hypothetical protein
MRREAAKPRAIPHHDALSARLCHRALHSFGLFAARAFVDQNGRGNRLSSSSSKGSATRLDGFSPTPKLTVQANSGRIESGGNIGPRMPTPKVSATQRRRQLEVTGHRCRAP